MQIIWPRRYKRYTSGRTRVDLLLFLSLRERSRFRVTFQSALSHVMNRFYTQHIHTFPYQNMPKLTPDIMVSICHFSLCLLSRLQVYLTFPEFNPPLTYRDQYPSASQHRDSALWASRRSIDEVVSDTWRFGSMLRLLEDAGIESILHQHVQTDLDP